MKPIKWHLVFALAQIVLLISSLPASALTDPGILPNVAGTLIHHPVGKGVGNVRNDGPELMEAIAVQGDLGLNSL